jgi:hypothetical protein
MKNHFSTCLEAIPLGEVCGGCTRDLTQVLNECSEFWNFDYVDFYHPEGLSWGDCVLEHDIVCRFHWTDVILSYEQFSSCWKAKVCAAFNDGKLNRVGDLLRQIITAYWKTCCQVTVANPGMVSYTDVGYHISWDPTTGSFGDMNEEMQLQSRETLEREYGIVLKKSHICIR